MEQQIISQGISLYELLTASGIIGGGIIAQWVHMKVTVNQIKTELGYLKERIENEEITNKERQTRIYSKIDSIFTSIEEIKIAIAGIQKK